MSRGAACFVYCCCFCFCFCTFRSLTHLPPLRGGKTGREGWLLLIARASHGEERMAGDVWRLGEVGWAVCLLAPCQLRPGSPSWALTLSSGHCSLHLCSPVSGSRRLSAVERYRVHTSPPAGNNFPINLSSSFPIWMCHLVHTNIIIDERCA